MKKIKINKIDETLYYDKLDNGLEIYVLPKSNMKNVYATFTTKYGSQTLNFVPYNQTNTIKVNAGVAHFLEHKMFEQETGELPFEFFTRIGADCNACTFLNYTSYLFNGPKETNDALNYLLDYVQAPYFTDENVKKEKGIIIEEARMYQDSPVFTLYDRIRFNAFKKNDIRYPIAGEVSDIEGITKEMLYDCYNTFYHPSNMFVIVAGNVDGEAIIKVIKDNQAGKVFKNSGPIKINTPHEPNDVFKSYEELQMNVPVYKIAYAVKIPLSKYSHMDPKRRNIYFSLIFELLFNASSDFYEMMQNKSYCLSEISIDKQYTDEHALMTLVIDTNHPQELINEIDQVLKHISITNNSLERYKKVLISNTIYGFEDLETINDIIMNDVILYNKFETDIDAIIETLNKKEMDKIINDLDLTHKSVLVIKPNNKS